MCLKNYRIDLLTLWMNGAYRHSVFKLLLWEYLDSSWERKTWGSLTQHLATLYCLWVQTGISNRCVCLFLPPSYTAMICWPISIHCKTSVSSENQKKAKRKRRIKNKTKQKNHPTLCPFKCSQPAKLPGFALTGCLPFKMKREAATDRNKGQLFGDARYLHKSTWGAYYFRSARVCCPTPALTHSCWISLHWH